MITQSASAGSVIRRILIADDDPFYRELATGSLLDAGYDVVTACDGKGALEVLGCTRVDLVIADVQMPEMTGLEFIEIVRSSDAYRHIPVIVITGQDDTGSIQRAYEAGATSFLAKPLNWALFVQHVNFVFKAGQAETELRDAIRTAEFMSDLKGRVVSVLVGEFQAPLRTAQGMAELLRKEVYGPLGHRLYCEYAEDLHKALDQLSSIQLKLMNSSRVMSGELLLKEEEIRLKELVMEVVRTVRPKADRRGIEIELRCGIPDDVALRGDRSLLGQAFKLLLEAAVGASPRGGNISIDARIHSDGGFNLTVEDGAPSLSDAMVREILGSTSPARHVVQQASTSRNTSLTICRVVMDAHGGRIALNSTAGEGSIIRLSLPTARVLLDGADPRPNAAAVGAEEETPLFRPGLRVAGVGAPHSGA
jgi:two-component system sensor histidine kinase/response regulator